jgi:hypothetical protein
MDFHSIRILGVQKEQFRPKTAPLRIPASLDLRSPTTKKNSGANPSDVFKGRTADKGTVAVAIVTVAL